MNTAMTWQTQSTNSDETVKLGEQIGQRLRGGETIELVSDLGGGKTTLVRGLAHGLGSPDRVSSPSFTLSNVYKAKSRTLYHFDFYRLSDPGIMAYELAEVVGQSNAVIVVEWGKIVEPILPKDRLTIIIKPLSQTKREITLRGPESYNYLIKGLS